MDSVLEQFRAGHEEVDRLKRAAANELSRSATTVSQSMSIAAPFFLFLPSFLSCLFLKVPFGACV